MDFNSILFSILCYFHILIWIFILLAFISIKTSKINLYIVIPIIYILHLLPFHILTETKKKVNKDNWEEDAESIDKKLIIPYYFIKLQNYLEKKCLYSPFSPQGMLLFGMISSSYRLYFYNKDCIKPKLKK
jgi:hypothetical protein